MASTFRPIRTVERKRVLDTEIDASPLRPRIERIAAALGAAPTVDETHAALDDPGRWISVRHRMARNAEGRTTVSSVATTTMLHRVAQFFLALAALPAAMAGLFYVAHTHAAVLSGRGIVVAVMAVALAPTFVHFVHRLVLEAWLARRQARVAALFDVPTAVATSYRVATVMPASEEELDEEAHESSTSARR